MTVNKHTGIEHTHDNNPELSCGCVLGIRCCSTMLQIQAMETIGYHHAMAWGDWTDYYYWQRVLWDHMGEKLEYANYPHCLRCGVEMEFPESQGTKDFVCPNCGWDQCGKDVVWKLRETTEEVVD